MNRRAGVVFIVLGGWLVALGCGSSSNTGPVCQETPFAGAGANTPTVDQTNNACTMAGGTCGGGSSGLYQCPPGTMQTFGSVGSACGGTSYGGTYGGGTNCGPQNAGASPAEQLIPCCLAADGGADGSSDADSAPAIGSCQGAPCAPGCACGILPETSKPYCFCEGADAGADASDAAAPTCGSIFCFSGCSCANAGASSCTCP
jgi:hypothetical protein